MEKIMTNQVVRRRSPKAKFRDIQEKANFISVFKQIISLSASTKSFSFKYFEMIEVSCKRIFSSLKRIFGLIKSRTPVFCHSFSGSTVLMLLTNSLSALNNPIFSCNSNCY